MCESHAPGGMRSARVRGGGVIIAAAAAVVTWPKMKPWTRFAMELLVFRSSGHCGGEVGGFWRGKRVKLRARDGESRERKEGGRRRLFKESWFVDL